MSIAAVPKYITAGDTNPAFSLTAPPGHRFTLYFPIWGWDEENMRPNWKRADWVPKMKRKGGQLEQVGWEEVSNKLYACMIVGGLLPPADELRPRSWKAGSDISINKWSELSSALRQRQSAMCRLTSDEVFQVCGVAISPFTTGLGNEHPLENGFSFLNPYGLPYLPGSGVKGVIRRAAEELASGEWGNPSEWSDSTEYRVPVEDEYEGEAEDEPDARKALSLMDLLFGKESGSGEKEHFRGVLTFWDVIPMIAGERLLVEILTPHFSHYYQREPAKGSHSPHDSGQPTPTFFLTVPPGSEFTFHVACDMRRLKLIAPQLAEGDRWKHLLETAFEHAFEWLGFGAKTAVGYGSMRRRHPASKPVSREGRESSGASEQSSSASSTTKLESSFILWPKALLKYDPGRRLITAQFENKRAVAPEGRSGEILLQLGAERAERLKSRKSLADVPVRVEQVGNNYTLLGLAESG